MTGEGTGPVSQEMLARLTHALSPSYLSITDDSAQHLGHAGYDGLGESHFTVELASPAFAPLSRVARQRLVYDALGDLMTTRIHALVIKTR